MEKQKPIFKKRFQEDKFVTSKNAKPHNVIDHASDKGNFIQFYNKGIEFYKLGNYDHAEKEFKKAIELDPNDIHAFYGLGNTHYCKAKYDNAVKVFIKAININPDYAKVHYSLSLAYGKLGMTHERGKHGVNHP